uniref:Macaca fascicularis brain cDNA clone: QtrA-16239, similar to human aquaporin 4 (AQP4), transcript variant b, mRNA, RefSeq: NM_004028.2 n=1 Tax=Macaca fascicularis TaxID=9541 RepID=I7GJB9_MACFA|nr:unnamed protein product [Macaca fascicularis]
MHIKERKYNKLFHEQSLIYRVAQQKSISQCHC